MSKSTTKGNPIDYQIGIRMIKLTVLTINNLGIGFNLLNYILQETEGIFIKFKDGSTNLNLTWKSLLGYEGLAILMNNPNLI